MFYRDSYKVKKYKNILSKNVTILESKKHFWDIKFKIKARIYPPFKQLLKYPLHLFPEYCHLTLDAFFKFFIVCPRVNYIGKFLL
ncbi:hypothetical protein F0G91_03475 [Campylobacter jejuni]|nr:hypothetical protein [Campylobacter jejuni]ECQ8812748.1 hypothetical protein [Campylobacter jejuni]